MIDGLYKVLAGLGYTDPLHAPITHMPIGLIFGALIFILLAIIFKKSNLTLTARHAAILAFVMVFPTILFGVFDWLHFWNGALSDPIKIKIILASVVLVILAAAIILGGEVKMKNALTTVLYALAFIAMVGLGWFGSKLVPGTYQAAARINAGYAGAGAPAAQTGAAMTAVKPAAQAGNVQAGLALFNGSCATCHLGGGNLIAPALPVKGSKQIASLTAFTAFIRAPKMPDGSAGSMPQFPANEISDAQAADLYAYVAAKEKSGWK
jgi:mono/diheme cytochrome c family protein